MGKAFRFQLQTALPNLAAAAGVWATLFALAYLTGVPQGVDNIVSTYYLSYTIVVPVLLYILAFGSCSGYLNLALSFGARRRDYFWGLQGILVLYVLAGWALACFSANVPTLFHWVITPQIYLFTRFGNPHFLPYPLFCLAFTVLGCFTGVIFFSSRAVGTVALLISILLGIAGLTFMAIGLSSFPGDIPEIISILSLAVTAVGEFFLWRNIKNAVVR